MREEYVKLRSNISMLGTLLGNTIEEAVGREIFTKIETIRQLSKSSRNGNLVDRQSLLGILKNLSNEELIPVAKAFNQFLNLANTAEQHQNIALSNELSYRPSDFKSLFSRLKTEQISDKAIRQALDALSIELVLTAHPTEINRRSLINKLVDVNNGLTQLDHDDLTEYEKSKIIRRLKQLMAQFWYTDEIRKTRPTPIDEAKWGFDVVENSLWDGVAAFLREFDEQLESEIGYRYAVNTTPVRFSSWMGGDRDGNPNVTAQITQYVLLLSRFRAAKLFLKDIQTLVTELSMSEATDEVKQLAGGDDVGEPYREIMKQLRTRLHNTIAYLEVKLEGGESLPPKDLLSDNQQLWQPLYSCYQSLIHCGMKIIADGALLDTLRRINCFGLSLVRLDIRQDSSRHTQVLSELTQYLDLGDYAKWNEQERQQFLITELASKRPLIPSIWQPSPETQEVLETCRIIAQSPTESIATYIISMAKAPSDVLAVHLLLKEANCPFVLPVTPLFETLDDLNNAEKVMAQLFSIEWYRYFIQHKQMVMIGYSDSAKDAGVLAASWAQYRAQEALVRLCEKEGIALTLFHGRGGSNGRGGVPAYAALLSQPPGSLKSGLRVTEQGEMIRFKLGLPQITIQTLTLYSSAILEANLLSPPKPKEEWRTLMDKLSAISCTRYRDIVQHNTDFVAYFRSATPEQELTRLPLGSRPAKRRADGGIESLRAIPWIFAWTQNRLMLPAWLGAGAALQQLTDAGYGEQLKRMSEKWPFFNTRLGMLEMVYAKTDNRIAEYYDHGLVDQSLWPLGEQLRTQLSQDIEVVLSIANDDRLMQTLPWIAESIALRNIYTDPLNLLQVELLRRSRSQQQVEPCVEQALMITISGIAAGMRNTG